MTRKIIRKGRLGARPQATEARVNPATEVISTRLRPKLLESHPVMGRIIALETRYEVSTQVDSSTVAERLPAMCGSETLTTVVSSTSMKVPSITETAMIQGLMTGWLSLSGIFIYW